MHRLFPNKHRKQLGFFYAEVLLSVILLAVLLVPAMQSLNSAIAGNSSGLAANQLNLRSKMEETLSNPFNELYSKASTSDTTTASSFSDTAGATNRRIVVLYRYDVATSALSSNDTGLIYVSVYYETKGSEGALNTLVGRWW